MTNRGFVLWLTGLPAAGKTSLAYALQEKLDEEGIKTVIIDSDDFREILTPHPTYTEAERRWFYGALARLAAWLAQNGINVIVAATANLHIYRDRARAQIERFAEVYVKCPLPLCRERDPKGIYALADANQSDTVPGIGAPYEPPFMPEAEVDMSRLLPTEAADSVLIQLRLQKIIPGTEQHIFADRLGDRPNHPSVGQGEVSYDNVTRFDA